MFLFRPFAAVLLLAAALGPTAARAGLDPSRFPAIEGRVAQYTLTPRGEVDGLLLTDGTEVQLPPHLGLHLPASVKPGDAVRVRGLRARAVPLVQAVTITNAATGQVVADIEGAAGQPGARNPDPPPETRPTRAEGTVRSRLHGPRGDLNGVLLADGTIIRFPPSEARRLADRLQPGTVVTAQGPGVEGPLGRVLEAARVATDLRPGAGRPRP